MSSIKKHAGKIAKRSGVNILDVKKVLEATTEVVKERLILGEDVFLPTLGTFKVEVTKERRYRTFNTREIKLCFDFRVIENYKLISLLVRCRSF